MKVGYLGPESSFTHQAARKQFSTNLFTYASIPACLKALLKDEVDLAIVPIENSLEGSVHHTIDLLSHEPELQVKNEVVLPIKQQFLIHPFLDGKEIKKILSHPQALAQSQLFLEENYPEVELVPMPSTTAAAEYVANHPKESVAAIASEETAAYFNLKILYGNIQDNDLNQTRFWLLGKPTTHFLEETPSKMSLILTLPANQPGMLHKMLAAFGWREINLSKIESRPLKTSLGEYFFVIDLLLDRPYELIDNAITEIELLGGKVQNLGGYPVKYFD